MARWPSNNTCWLLGAIALSACGASPAPVTTVGATSAGGGVDVTRYDDSTPSGNDGQRLAHAVELMDTRHLEAATEILEDLRRRLPDNGVVLHELALAYRLGGRPERAVAVLGPYEEVLDVTATAGLGSAADEANDAARAETVLRRGIVRHPHAGLLFSELAVVLGRQNRLDEALGVFISGMSAEPGWPTNYLHGANLMSRTPAAGMSLYWGEIFRLLEPGSERSRAMAGVMVEVLRTHVDVAPRGADGQRTITVRLAPGSAEVTMRQGGVLTMPFVHALEMSEGTALGVAVLHGLGLASLHQARAAFFGAPDPRPRTELFRWVGALAAAGHLEAYDAWLYGPAFPDEAAAWTARHSGEMEALERYLRAHPFTPTESIAPDAPVPLPVSQDPAPVPAGAI